MSQPSSFNPGSFGQGGGGGSFQPVQKQRYGVYTILMLLAFAALITGCILLHLELKLYG